MKLWQKLLIPTAIAMLIAGVYLFIVFKGRENPGAATAPKVDEVKAMTPDELAFVKQYLFASFDQAKQMENSHLWIKAGYSLPYYPYSAGAIQFSKRVGELPAAEELAVSKIIKALVPAKEDDRIEHGSRQYFIVFTIVGPDKMPGTFAAPFGYAQGDNETILADQLFYYNDPKTIFSHWPAPVWTAVAAHTPALGMSEDQARMAAGIMIESESTREGDRTVTYNAGPKKWTVTFAKGTATAVKPG